MSDTSTAKADVQNLSSDDQELLKNLDVISQMELLQNLDEIENLDAGNEEK